MVAQSSSDLRKRKLSSTYRSGVTEREETGLETLATAAVLGDDENQATPSIAATTKHPRHRPGCTCIVCIQPPSGKGPKHKPTCTCNVCMTVKRRFKTLMMRKKERQSEQEEAEANKKPVWTTKDDTEADNSSKSGLPLDMPSQNESDSGHDRITAEIGKKPIDLNCQPERAEDPQAGQPPRVSMMSLLHVANLPLETYLKQNGLTSLASEQQQASSSSHALPQAPMESEGRTAEESCFAPPAREKECVIEEGCSESDQAPKDPA